MKNPILIIISVFVIVGASVLVFMNLPEDNNIPTTSNTISNTEEQESKGEILENEDQFEMEQDMEEVNNNIENKPKSNQNSNFTMNEVSTHNSKDDCYLVIKNNVYDVSSFIDSHPGGTQKISEKCGQEVTGIFAQIHSNKAWDLLIDYKIGTISN